MKKPLHNHCVERHSIRSIRILAFDTHNQLTLTINFETFFVVVAVFFFFLSFFLSFLDGYFWFLDPVSDSLHPAFPQN